MHEVVPVPMKPEDFREMIRRLRRMQDQLILHQRSLPDGSRAWRMTQVALHWVCQTYREIDMMFHAYEVWLKDEDDPRICFRCEGWFLDANDPDWIKDDKHPDIVKVVVAPRYWERRFEEEAPNETNEQEEDATKMGASAEVQQPENVG